jgi:hypothetical protein
MKVHAKLGGVTHAVPQPTTLDSKTLMIGADVSAIQIYNTMCAYYRLLIRLRRSLVPFPRPSL